MAAFSAHDPLLRYDLKYERNIVDWLACRRRSNVLLLFYEDMLTDPRASLRQIADFIGVQVRYDLCARAGF